MALHSMAYSVIELCKPLHHKTVIYEGVHNLRKFQKAEMGLPFCDILQTFHHPLPGLQFTFSILESDILFFLHFPSSSLPQKLLKRIFISTLNGLPSAPQSHGPCEMCHLGHHRLLVAPRKGTPPQSPSYWTALQHMAPTRPCSDHLPRMRAQPFSSTSTGPSPLPAHL